MKKRPDMQSEASPEGLEILQLTTEMDVPSSHIYMEAQIFTPDSKRFILHRSAHPHGSDPQDPEHQYLICDLENNCELIPITKETGTTALLFRLMEQPSTILSMRPIPAVGV